TMVGPFAVVNRVAVVSVYQVCADDKQMSNGAKIRLDIAGKRAAHRIGEVERHEAAADGPCGATLCPLSGSLSNRRPTMRPCFQRVRLVGRGECFASHQLSRIQKRIPSCPPGRKVLSVRLNEGDEADMVRVINVVGARPNFMKIAPI